jgi:micrococcal nuclease
MKDKRIFIAATALILIIAVIFIVYAIVPGTPKKTFKLVTIDPKAYYKVVSVIDGDTFQADINRKLITVRVLGIDTPETVDPRKPIGCYGKEASSQAKELLAGRQVRLVSNPDRERTDKYHRYLLYVYRDDGLFYNEYMIEHGFAHEYTFNHESYQFQSEFKKAESEAKASGAGLWRACPQKSS